jgi:hypothetical protein
MSTGRTTLIASCASTLALCVIGLMGFASDSPDEQDTNRILATIDATRSAKTASDLRAARHLNDDGDRAYRRHRYDDAFMAYANSYPNYPNAYAYVMAGDAHWRDVVRYQELEGRRHAADHAGCNLDNSHFAHDLAGDLAQHYDVGLALAQRDKARVRGSAGLYARARESARCLKAMVQEYEAKPPEACIDLKQLRDCLGAPLIQ